MTPKKPSAIKPVKAWAIVNPEGHIRLNISEKKPSLDMLSPFLNKYQAKEKGYRAIRVLISPLP